MEKKKIHIKNMVCARCIMTVERILEELDIDSENLELGQVSLKTDLDSKVRNALQENLSEVGFELLEPGRSSLISKIKTLIINQIHHSEETLNKNFSTFLSEKLYYEYSYLSRLFSSVEGITIEKYIARQRIEKVKEMLFYDELTLSEIGFRMNYSSVAYLSTQFKRETGMTPTQFRNTHQPGHRHLDCL